jgi:hypothetical protein
MTGWLSSSAYFWSNFKISKISKFQNFEISKFQKFLISLICSFSMHFSVLPHFFFIVFMIQGLNLHIEGENVTKLVFQAYTCFIAFIFRLLLHMRSLVHCFTRSLAYPIVYASFFYCLCIQ